MKKTIQDYKKEATLNKVFRYPEGIMSRLEWLRMMQVKGSTVKEETRRNHAAEQKLEEWIFNNRGDNSGNPNWPTTKNWLRKKEELKAGIFKTVYSLHIAGENSFQEITKTEYDAFLALELESDLLTQKMEITYKIEAGTATEQEINEAMQKEYEFAAKYF